MGPQVMWNKTIILNININLVAQRVTHDGYFFETGPMMDIVSLKKRV